jgi:hypothetical protein
MGWNLVKFLVKFTSDLIFLVPWVCPSVFRLKIRQVSVSSALNFLPYITKKSVIIALKMENHPCLI